MNFEELLQSIEYFQKDGLKPIDVVNQALSQQFWNGFDACLEMVLNSLDNQESNEIAKFTVWDFIEDFKAHLIEEADLYKKCS